MVRKALLLTAGIVLWLLAACAPPYPPTLGGAGNGGHSCTLRLATTTSTADSGLLAFILPDFEQKFHCKVDVIAVGTGQAIQIGIKGDADLLLVHDRAREEEFVREGHALERRDVMYNDFVILGPANDPAKIGGLARGADAFRLIAGAPATFVSRGDGSGTHAAEMRLWSAINISPTKESWYNSLGQGMGETLLAANEKGAYTFTDRGTYLSLKNKLPNLVVLVGGHSISENPDEALFNLYGVMAVNPGKHPGVNSEMATGFVQWITSVEVQKRIGSYTNAGQTLFHGIKY